MSHMVGGWNCTSEQRSFTVCFVPLVCLRTFVCVSFHTQMQVVANRCALQHFVFGLDTQCLWSSSAPWHAQYQAFQQTHRI